VCARMSVRVVMRVGMYVGMFVCVHVCRCGMLKYFDFRLKYLQKKKVLHVIFPEDFSIKYASFAPT